MMKLTLMTVLLSLITSCGKEMSVSKKPVYGSSDEVVLNANDISTTPNTRPDQGSLSVTGTAPSSTPAPSESNSPASDPIRVTSGLSQIGDGQYQDIRRVSFNIRMDNSEVNEGSPFIVHFTNTGEAPIDVALLNYLDDSLYSYESNNCGQIIEMNQGCTFFYNAHLIQDSQISGVLTNLTISYSSPEQTSQASLNVRFKNMDYVSSSNTGGSGFSEEELNTYLEGGRHTVRDCINKEYFGSKGEVVLNMSDYKYYCQFRSFDYNVGYQPRVETKLTVNHIQNSLVNGLIQDSYFCPGDWNIRHIIYERARVKEHRYFGIRWKDVMDSNGESICTDYSQIRFKCVKREILFPRLTKVNCF